MGKNEFEWIAHYAQKESSKQFHKTKKKEFRK